MLRLASLVTISIPLAFTLACGDDGSSEGEGFGSKGETVGSGDGDGDPTGDGDGDGDPTGDGDGDGDPSGDGDGDPTGGTKFDMASLPDTDDTPLPPSCKVVDDMNAIGQQCRQSAPPDSFEPDVQWSYTGPPGFDQAIATPLVINLTDDDQNGEIDLCDIPDVLVVVGPQRLEPTGPSRSTSRPTGRISTPSAHRRRSRAARSVCRIRKGEGAALIRALRCHGRSNSVAPTRARPSKRRCDEARRHQPCSATAPAHAPVMC